MRRVKQKGMVAMVIVITVLAILTIITLFSARVIVTDNKIFNNTQDNVEAYNAAQAGFNFALGFLNSTMLNQEAVIASPGTGITLPTPVPAGEVTSNLNSCSAATNTATLANGTLPNGATYTMKFGCIAKNAVNTLALTAVGTSADGTSTRTVQAQIYRFEPSVTPLVTVAAPTFGNNNSVAINNNVTGAVLAIDTAAAAGSVNVRNANLIQVGNPLGTQCATGTGACAAIKTGDAALTAAALQTTYMGSSTALATLCPSTVAAFTANPLVDYYVRCTNGNPTYTAGSPLQPTGGGLTCTINNAPGVTPANPAINAIFRRTVCIYSTGGGGGNVTFQGVTVGTAEGGAATGPDIIIINNAVAGHTLTIGNTGVMTGGIYTSENVAINNASAVVNGVLFVTSGTYAQTAGSNVNGEVAVDGGAVSFTNNVTKLTRVSTALSNVSGGALLGYAVAPGSWRDF